MLARQLKMFRFMTFSDEERAELIAAVSKTADMVELLLRQIDLLIFAQESGRG